MEDSHSWVYSDGHSGKWKLRMNLLYRFCSCLQVWNPIIWSLRNDVRAVSFHILFHPRIQARHWKESHAFCVLASWGPTDATVSSPDRCLLLPRYVQLALCKADGVPFWEVLPALHVCFEDVGFGKYRGPGKEEAWEVWEVSCVRSEMQSKAE